MTVNELGPSSVASNTSSRFKTEGGSTFDDVHVPKLKDNSDSTYATVGASSALTTLQLYMNDPPGIAVNQRVAALRAKGRFVVATGHQGIMRMRQGTTLLHSAYIPGTSKKGNFYGDWVKTSTGGAEWTETLIDGVRLEFTVASALSTLYRYMLEYDLRTQANAAPAWPTGGTFAGPTSQFSWGYEGYGDAQTKFELKIFEASVVEGEADSFDPGSSDDLYTIAATQSSPSYILYLGEAGDYLNAPDGQLLDLDRGGSYYWSVRVAKDFNGTSWWSDWSAPSNFVYQNKPSLTVSAPIGSVTTTTSPLVDWEFDDPDDGRPQQAFAVKVFAEPDAGWGGFNPGRPQDRVGETTAPIARSMASGPITDSSVVRGTASSWRINKPLANDTEYRAYVWVQKSDPVDGRRGSGEWELNLDAEFSIDIARQAAPIVTVQASPEEGRMSIVVATAPADTTSTFLTILRSTDGVHYHSFPITLSWFGAHRMSSRHMGGFALSFSGGDNQFYDYTMPLNTQVYYKAYTIRVVTGSEIAGLSAEDADSVSSNRTWFSDPYGDGAIVSYPVTDDWLALTRPTPRTIHRPIGRKRALVNRGQTQGEEFTVNFLVLGKSHFNEFMEWMETKDTWMFRNEDKAWWVQVAGDITWEDYLWDNSQEPDQAAQKVAVPFIEVADPNPDDEIEA